jgi:hypothetical protein
MLKVRLIMAAAKRNQKRVYGFCMVKKIRWGFEKLGFGCWECMKKRVCFGKNEGQ